MSSVNKFAKVTFFQSKYILSVNLRTNNYRNFSNDCVRNIIAATNNNKSAAGILVNNLINNNNKFLYRNFSCAGGAVTKSSACTMRFVQYKHKNNAANRIGIVSEDGTTLMDLSGQSCCPSDMINFIKAIGPDSTTALDDIKKKMISGFASEPITNDMVLLPPVTNPEKIICIGLNYLGHCQEQNKEAPKEPMFFSKFASALTGPTGDVIHHNITNSLDWEVELAVIIGKEAKHIKKEQAMDYVFGYCVAQDISARDWQKQRNGGQFLIGKSMDTSCPLGPAIVHKSLVPDPHNLNITCKINGVQKQCGSTSELIFRIDDIIYRLSQSMTLKPGDVILTGTPSGVGMHRQPPEYLKPGDVIESEIQCLGKLINTVVPDKCN